MKFKKGDKVRILGNSPWREHLEGKIGTITVVDEILFRVDIGDSYGHKGYPLYENEVEFSYKHENIERVNKYLGVK